VANGTRITEADLKSWKLLEQFQKELDVVAAKHRFHRTFSDERRQLSYNPYLSLFLLGLFNPVVESMRSLCAITHLKKVQEVAGCPRVSLGSFSELQHVLDPDLLKQVFERIAEKIPPGCAPDARLEHIQAIAQDGSLWRALPRMAWAEYGVGPKGDANGVRLHLRLNVFKGCPEDALIGKGNSNERKAFQEMLLPGQTNIGDRFYGMDYKLFRHVEEARAFLVLRINNTAVVNLEESLEITLADRAAGVIRHAWVRLGATEKLLSQRVRLVEVKKDGQHLLIVTNHTVEQLPAELVSLLYRHRWSIELFFRWIKCVLGCRHFFAESPEGVSIQLYMAMIAGLLLHQLTGSRPSKRTLEMLQLLMMGWATPEEVLAFMLKEAERKLKSSR
jgi:Transposase DDE domain